MATLELNLMGTPQGDFTYSRTVSSGALTRFQAWLDANYDPAGTNTNQETWDAYAAGYVEGIRAAVKHREASEAAQTASDGVPDLDIP